MNLGKEEQSVEILKHIQNEHLIFDGAMGTMLQKSGLEIGGIPDLLSLTNPKLIQSIHREYVEAGCDCITTNTFGANRLKIKDTDIATLVTAAVENAKAANPKYVALDIGPIGQLMAPLGTLSFEEAYDIFKEQLVAGEKAGADLVIFETFSDLMELKVGILAAKENTKLPVFATMTYQDNGRTFVGVDPVSSTISLQGLGVDALGVNCSLGPDELIPVVETILKYATVPVMVQANAGLPDMQGNYGYSSEEYSERMLEMANMGVRVLGGCCGTTPEFIEKTKDKVKSLKPVKTSPKRVTAVCSASSTVILDEGIHLIGERINPTGKPKLKEALKKEDYDYILNEAITQADLGADILDVNVGLPEIDEPKLLKKAVMELQSGISQPLQIDSTDAKAVEEAVRVYKGKPLINSVNGEEESMKAIFPIAKKYGACVLGLCLDKNGIPETAEGRFEIAQRILDTALSYGIPKEDILIDCLVLTASAQQEQVVTTLEAIKLVKSRLGLKCVLGVSNVSFGLPNRPLLNSVFLAAAFGAGLDAPIINPCSKEIMDAVSIPVMAKCRIGHFVEAQILEAIGIDYIDESEVLSPADDKFHVDKKKFKVPFVCGAKDLGEALRRIAEGASMIRTKGEPGTGDVVQAVRHMRMMNQEIRRIQNMREDELYFTAKELQVPFDLVKFVHENGKLPVVNFAAGGVATPADAALMMQLGAEGVFVGSGIFKSGDPVKRAQAIVKAVTNYNDPKILAEISEDLGEAMVGINESEIQLLMAERGK